MDKTLKDLLKELHGNFNVFKMLREETIDKDDFINAVEQILEHYDL